jgi:hypothetical protein
MQDEIIVKYLQDGYVHALHYGDANYETSLELWRRIVAVCKEYNCFNILGESHNTKDLSTMDAFNHLKILDEVGLTLRYRVAWVIRAEGIGRGIEFDETVIVKNRGLVQGGIFPSVEEARRWLLGEEQAES